MEKRIKHSFDMIGSDINFIIAVADCLGISQSDVMELIIEMARQNKKIFGRAAEIIEEKAKKLRMISEGKLLKCFGTCTMQDVCCACPNNEECAEETCKREVG